MPNLDHRFEGSIPEFYDRYMGPLFFQPYAADLVASLSGFSNGQLLELAAGTGILSRGLAHSLPPAVTIVATDLNQAMLDYAAARTDKRVSFRQADAQQLPFPDQSFDCVVSQFGVMFFPDKLAAYREVHRVLKPGAFFLFSAWDRIERNELSFATVQALREFFLGNPPSFLSRTPFGYFDTAQIQAQLREASFSTSQIKTVPLSCHASSPGDAALGLVQGSPLRNELAAMNPGLVDEVTAALTASLTSRFGSGPFTTPMQAHVCVARR